MGRRVILVVLVMALAGLGGAVAGRFLSSLKEAPEVTVADLVGGQTRFEGKAVVLVLEYDKRSPDDPAAELISRSDCHLHDATGSILLSGGWQVWTRWCEAKEYTSTWLDVDAAGVWRVKQAVVRYNEAGLPYLEPPPG